MEQWFALNEKLRFLILAGINMFIRYLLFIGFGFMMGTRHYQIILALSWGLSVFVAFLSYKYLVFGSKGKHLPEFLRSVLIWFFTYLFNVYMLDFLVAKMGLNVYLAQGIIICIIFVVNYFLFKNFAFSLQK